MIKFIDIESGNVFDGSKPYIFWLEGGQSVNLIYTKKICVLSDQSELTITIPENAIFNLLDMNRLNELADIDINEFKYKDIKQLYTNSVTSTGFEYSGYYIHMVYIAAQSDSIGEIHEELTIGDETFEIAADFYMENESLKINLTNFGVELPESIQSTVYDSNVHEESKDNILLNRKYKELLLNYWNIVAGRGNYKSLLDSLSWFEYGDLVKIDEIWRHDEWSQTRYNREELNSIMTKDLQATLSNFTKTTYIGLYLALQKYLIENGQVQYDKLADFEVNISPEQSEVLLRDNTSNDYEGLLGEMTPKLENKLFKWSVQDMSMKMYLLGCFYESYFMPIHLDLMHSTIESLVFANTIKCLNANYLDRVDHVFNTEAFECSVKDGDAFKLQDVQVQGGSMLKRHWDDSDDSDSYETSMVKTYQTKNKGYNPVEFVDLGLPSGLLWAKCNLGASSEGDVGGYYAWGESDPNKQSYWWNSYELCRYVDKYEINLIKYCSIAEYEDHGYHYIIGYNGYTDDLTRLELSDDAAYKTSKKCVIPTRENFQELINNTRIVRDTVNNLAGLRFISLQDSTKSIFLPAAGYKYGSSTTTDYNSILHYWTSDLAVGDPLYSHSLFAYSSTPTPSMGSNRRDSGLPIRPVNRPNQTDDSSDDYDNYPIFGVEEEYNHPMQLDGESSDDNTVNDRLKTFMVNNYNGIGTVIPFHCEIPAEKNDFINYEKIVVSVYKDNQLYSSKELEKHNLHNEEEGKFDISFNLLLTEEGKNVVTLYFSTAGGRSYIKTLHLDIVGDVGCRLKLYKVKSSKVLTGLNTEDYDRGYEQVYYPYQIKERYIRPINDHIFTHVRSDGDLVNGYYRTYIPCDATESGDGAKLNYVLIFNTDFFNEAEQSTINNFLTYISEFDIGAKYVTDENGDPTSTVKYYILVSKKFVGSGNIDGIIQTVRRLLNHYIVRFSTGYFFQHHYLEELGLGKNDKGDYEFGETLDEYTITDQDTLCVVPGLKYSNLKLTDIEWIFENASTKDKEKYYYPSIKEPFVGSDISQKLKPGFYNIIFRYKVGDTLCETRLNSAFRKM